MNSLEENKNDKAWVRKIYVNAHMQSYGLPL